MIFNRALSAPFVARLAEENARGGWWHDVLRDPGLLVAPRGKYLNVYWHGQALFTVRCPRAGLTVTTHEKFLVDPVLAKQVPLVAGRFQIAATLARGFIEAYEGPATLQKMKRAAKLFAGTEKSGCHDIALRNSSIIDVEIAFSDRSPLSEENDDRKGAPRVDFASVEADGEDVRLAFWEAKAYSNGGLRALGEGRAPVCDQIDIYRHALAQHRPEIEASYAAVAKNLISFKEMGWQRPLSPLIESVGRGERRLTLGATPKVGLVIFGFDIGQRDEPRWQAHLARLSSAIGNVVPVGKSSDIQV